MSQSSIAASTAATMPTMICTTAAVVPANPRIHGDTSTHSPTSRFNHSYHTANAANPAIDRAATIMPQMYALVAAGPEVNPNIHGDTNRKAPRMRFRTSQIFGFDHSVMVTSEGELKPSP